MFVLSMIVYGVAFDFFNISGSLFVNICHAGEVIFVGDDADSCGLDVGFATAVANDGDRV